MMETKEIRRLSRKIRTRYRIRKIDLKSIRQVIQNQGYTIVEFNTFDNDEETAVVIEHLDLTDLIARLKGFTYADSECRFVFLNRDLSDEEKLLVLAHEEGHIACGHLEHAPILGNSVTEEDEANQFAHYLLRPSLTDSCRVNGHIYKRRVIAICLVIAAVVGMTGWLLYYKKQLSYYGEYYLTESGGKYHEKECIFVKDKTNIRRLTLEEYENGEYEPCQVCLPGQ